jgi:hypothetical protein
LISQSRGSQKIKKQKRKMEMTNRQTYKRRKSQKVKQTNRQKDRKAKE